MSKYKELAELACDQAAETFSIRQECEVFARDFAFGYKRFLEVPEEHFTVLKINSDLTIVGKEEGICWPKIVRSADGFWYFAFSIHYELPSRKTYVDQNLKIGVRPSEDKWIVRMDSDRYISKVHADELEVLFMELYKEDIKQLSAPVSSPKQKIGFV